MTALPPNTAADPGGNSLSHSVTYSSSAFAREADAYTRYLRRAYRERLLAGDDGGVASVARAARAVERATVVHASAATLATVRGRPPEDPAAAADAAAAKEYLAGVQARLAGALRARDVLALAAITDAAEAAMHALAHPNAAFADVAGMPLLAEADAAASQYKVGEGDDTAYDPYVGNRDVKQPHILSYVFPWVSTVAQPMSGFGAPNRRRRGCCGVLGSLSATDRVVVVVYILMLCAALVMVGLITSRFVNGLRRPGSFLRPRTEEALTVPVVTLCLSQTGVPFSRLQIFNFTDATGVSFRGADPEGTYKERRSPEFDGVVERFWDNPDNEDCDKILGDFFPLPVKSLNELAAGNKSSLCRPCYRMGKKREVKAYSTRFENSSFIHAFTDNYFLECMKRPGGLAKSSEEFLHNLILKIVKSKDDGLSKNQVLVREDNGPLSNLTLADIQKISGAQQCNIFYFGLFPKALGKLPPTNRDIQYQFTRNGTWNFIGIGTEFVPPGQKPVSNYFPLESLQMFVSSQANTTANSLRGQRDMALIGPNTQTYASFRPLLLYSDSRYDVQTSTSNFIDTDVRVLFGYWYSYRIFYNYNRFIIDEYYRESTYTFSQWLIDFTGYLSLFTGASVFSVLVLPVLYSVRAQQRKKMRNDHPEAYFWHKYSRHIGRARFARGGESSAPVARGAAEEAGNANVRLPGYNV